MRPRPARSGRGLGALLALAACRAAPPPPIANTPPPEDPCLARVRAITSRHLQLTTLTLGTEAAVATTRVPCADDDTREACLARGRRPDALEVRVDGIADGFVATLIEDGAPRAFMAATVREVWDEIARRRAAGHTISPGELRPRYRPGSLHALVRHPDPVAPPRRVARAVWQLTGDPGTALRDVIDGATARGIEVSGLRMPRGQLTATAACPGS